MVKIKTVKNVKKIKINGYYYRNSSKETNWQPVWTKQPGEVVFTMKEHVNYKFQEDRYVWQAKFNCPNCPFYVPKTWTYSLGQIKPLFKEAIKNNDLTVI